MPRISHALWGVTRPCERKCNWVGRTHSSPHINMDFPDANPEWALRDSVVQKAG